MKNMIKLTIAVIAAFAAVSCAPEVEITDLDWKTINAARDATQNNGTSYDAPTASVTDTTEASGTITAIDVDITIPERADVLRKAITASSLDFITFHTFTKATEAYTADTLDSAIPFTLVSRQGNVVSVKLTTSINTAADYSGLVMRIDGKKYTYDRGLRLDVDNNGKIEAGYDDYYYDSVSGFSGSGITGFVSPGQKTAPTVTLPGVSTNTMPTGTPAPTTVNTFYFIGDAQTTNANTLNVAYIGTGTSDAQKAYYKDIGDTIAKGVKLQKLNGTKWADVKTAVYEVNTSDNGYIVIKDVSFEHRATYRLIWTGSAYTETSGTYYGVKQRLYVGYGRSGAARYKVTEVAAGAVTTVNSNVARFLDSSDFSTGVTITSSYDSEYKNAVIRVMIKDNDPYRYYWNSVSLADFKKSFKLVFATTSGKPDNSSANLVYVDVKDVKFAAEDWAVDGGTTLGNNVLYITLDPAYRYNPNALDDYNAAYSEWETTVHDPWQTEYDAFVAWWNQYYAWQQGQSLAQSQFGADHYTWQQEFDDWCAIDDDNDGTPDNDPDDWDYTTKPEPVLQDYLDDAATSNPKPGETWEAPAYPTEPTFTYSGSGGLYARINNGISVTDKKTPETVQYFGSAEPFYDNFDFYGPL